MKRNRLLYRLSAWAVIASLLLMHVSVSAYTCPSSNVGAVSGCTGSLDADQPDFCKKHGEVALQLVGGSFPPAAPVTLIVTLLPLPPLADFDDPSQPRLDSFYLSRLAPDGSPPLFLRLQVLLT